MTVTRQPRPREGMGTFTIRRYRLSTMRESLVVLAPARVTVTSAAAGMVQVRFSHAADHEITAGWTESLAPGEWVSIHGWAQDPEPVYPPDVEWPSLWVSAQFQSRGPTGFLAERVGAESPMVFSRSEPPVRAGLTTVTRS